MGSNRMEMMGPMGDKREQTMKGQRRIRHDRGYPWVYFAVPLPIPMNTIPVWLWVQFIGGMGGFARQPAVTHGFLGGGHTINYNIIINNLFTSKYISHHPYLVFASERGWWR
jgi:hypothetical protein